MKRAATFIVAACLIIGCGIPESRLKSYKAVAENARKALALLSDGNLSPDEADGFQAAMDRHNEHIDALMEELSSRKTGREEKAVADACSAISDIFSQVKPVKGPLPVTVDARDSAGKLKAEIGKIEAALKN